MWDEGMRREEIDAERRTKENDERNEWTAGEVTFLEG